MTVPDWLGWLLLALPLDAAPAGKCGLLSVESELVRAEVVFSGTVTRMAEHYVAPVTILEPARPNRDGTVSASAGRRIGTPGRAATFAVTRGWKGAAAADTLVVHDLLPYPQLFLAGAEYLVYAVREEDGRLATSRCERTRPLAEVPGDVRQLDSLVAHRGA